MKSSPQISTKSLFYVDDSSIVRLEANNDKVIRVWTKVIFKKPQKLLGKKINAVKTMRKLMLYNCSKNTNASQSVHLYDVTDEYIDGTEFNNPEFMSIIPESAGETGLKYVCIF